MYTATVAQEASNPGVQKMIDDSTVLYISIRPSSVRGVSPVGCGFHSVLRRALQLRVIVAGAHTHTHSSLAAFTDGSALVGTPPD